MGMGEMATWRGGSDQRGAAAVEFAVVLPLLLTMLFGIIEMGFVFNRWITVTHAAREGVRRMSVGDPAATAAAKAQGYAVGVNASCSASTPSPNMNQMVCSATYDMQLFIYDRNVVVRHTARAAQE
jgi:Flp pilus assembly protein TadG